MLHEYLDMVRTMLLVGKNTRRTVVINSNDKNDQRIPATIPPEKKTDKNKARWQVLSHTMKPPRTIFQIEIVTRKFHCTKQIHGIVNCIIWYDRWDVLQHTAKPTRTILSFSIQIVTGRFHYTKQTHKSTDVTVFELEMLLETPPNPGECCTITFEKDSTGTARIWWDAF